VGQKNYATTVRCSGRRKDEMLLNENGDTLQVLKTKSQQIIFYNLFSPLRCGRQVILKEALKTLPGMVNTGEMAVNCQDL
jgi:hypothetical protein